MWCDQHTHLQLWIEMALTQLWWMSTSQLNKLCLVCPCLFSLHTEMAKNHFTNFIKHSLTWKNVLLLSTHHHKKMKKKKKHIRQTLHIDSFQVKSTRATVFSGNLFLMVPLTWNFNNLSNLHIQGKNKVQKQSYV